MKPVGLTPEDFKMLPKDGARFEALVCQLLEAMGYRILERPAVGTEGGRDVLVERVTKDAMIERHEKVVVQCKHYAHSGKAIGDSVVGVWQNAMTRYKARGYLLVTDTHVTENLSRSLREFTEDEMNFPKWAAFWEVDQLIRYLNEHPNVRDSFFPPESITPMAPQDLAGEVQTWLQAIRYKVDDLRQLDDRRTSMVATLDEGTVKQSVRVHCIGGEITPSDVKALESALDLRTPQGWLISDKRVSQKARQLAAAEESHVQVFDLAGFLEEKIWKVYFSQLRTLVEQNQISELYVDLGCYKKEMDEEGREIGRDRYASLDAYIDDWLTERGKMHISLLGEFGTGKTWFCRHYAYRQLGRYLNDPANKRLPLLITLRAFTKAMTAQQLINDALLEQYRLPFVGSPFEVFQKMNRRGKLLLILDGFDEMARQADYQTVVDNFWELAKLVGETSKVILTSRTEYFRWAKESEKILGGKEFGRSTIVLSPPRFEVLHLEQFSDDQIREVITRRLGTADGPEVADQILRTPNLAEMAHKPILVELLLAALDEVSADVLKNPAQVYLYATNKLLLRNIDTQRTFTTTADKLYFMCELAWEMIKSGELRIHYTDIPERIEAYFGDQIKDQHELDVWGYDLRNHTLLHRDTAGYYEFAHKSLAEYFVAYKFAAELGCLAPAFAETYFEADGKPCEMPIAHKHIHGLAETFGAMALTDERMRAICNLLPGLMTDDGAKRLWEVIDETKGKTFEQSNYVGGNAATLLRTLGESFKGARLARTVLIGADLSNTDLTNADLHGANLYEAVFTNIELAQADLREADLTNSHFNEMQAVLALDFSSDGTQLASAGVDGVVRLWHLNATTRAKEYTSLGRHQGFAWGLSFSPDNQLLASGGNDKLIRIWNVSSESEYARLEGHTAGIWSVRFSPDGNHLVSFGGYDRTIRLWNIRRKTNLFVIQSQASFVYRGSYRCDGKYIVSAGDDEAGLEIIDTATGQVVRRIRTPGEHIVCSSFSPDGNFIACGSGPGVFRVFDFNGNLLLQSMEHRAKILGVAFSPNGSYIATASNDRTVKLWDLDKRAVSKTLKGHTDGIVGLAWAPNGTVLASGSDDATIRIWNVEPNSPTFGQCLKVLEAKIICQGMRISGARGLEQEMEWRVEGQKRKGMLLEFLADRGAVLDEEQERIVGQM